MTILSIHARSRTVGLGAKSWCNHPSQTLPGPHPEHDVPGQTASQSHCSTQDGKSEDQSATATATKKEQRDNKQAGKGATESGSFREPKRLHEVIQFRTYADPRERGGRLFHSLGVGITELLERCIVREGSLCIFEPMDADWGGFPTATLLMLLGVPASGAAAALAEAFAPLDRQESQRRQSTLTELLTEMERIYGSSVRFALAHGSDAALLGNLRFAYLAR